jgi:hypothetical protein
MPPNSLRSARGIAGVTILALAMWSPACESSAPTVPSGFARARSLPACPALPTTECPFGVPCPSNQWTAGHLVTCPSKAEIEAIDSEIVIQADDDLSAWGFACREDAGSRDLTYAERDVYWGLAFLRQLQFTRPLPWTDRPLYEWFRQQVRRVVIETGTRSHHYNDLTRTIHIYSRPGFDPDADWAYVRLPYELLAHEARHGDGPPHNCGNSDSHISMMGSDGIVWYVNHWIANYSNQPPEIREAASLLNLYQIRKFCYECEREDE